MKSPFQYYGVPLDDFSNQLRSLVSELLTETPNESFQPHSFPLCNLEWNEEKVLLTFEIPGIAKEDLDIQLQNNVVSVSGERKNQYTGKLIRSERFVGKFSRSIKLPFAVENENVNAQFNNGILTLDLVRKEDSKPKKVIINSL